LVLVVLPVNLQDLLLITQAQTVVILFLTRLLLLAVVEAVAVRLVDLLVDLAAGAAHNLADQLYLVVAPAQVDKVVPVDLLKPLQHWAAVAVVPVKLAIQTAKELVVTEV
jgi:hypothetical protein